MQSITFNADEDASLAREFSSLDVQRAFCNIKNNRAAGVDEIPREVLKNGSVIFFYANYAICAMILVKFQIYGASL